MLLRFHKILMGCCFVFCLLFSLSQYRLYALGEGTAPLVRALLGDVGAVALACYLVYLFRKGGKILDVKRDP